MLLDKPKDDMQYLSLRASSLVMSFLAVALSTSNDHVVWRTGLPVRSVVLKAHAGKWGATTCEFLLFYVFALAFLILFKLVFCFNIFLYW